VNACRIAGSYQTLLKPSTSSLSMGASKIRGPLFPRQVRGFPFVFFEVGRAEAFRERDVIRIRDNFQQSHRRHSYPESERRLCQYSAAEGDAADKNNFVQEGGELVDCSFQ
jgi:hypothetical protein